MLEPTIYRTRGEHANHYTTDAVTIFVGAQTILIYVGTGITQRLFGSNWSSSLREYLLMLHALRRSNKY